MPVVKAAEVTGVPMIVVFCRMVKVTVPALTVPAVAVTLAVSATDCGVALKGAVASWAAVVVLTVFVKEKEAALATPVAAVVTR